VTHVHIAQCIEQIQTNIQKFKKCSRSWKFLNPKAQGPSPTLHSIGYIEASYDELTHLHEISKHV
jgi:hypothetical protein